MMDAMNEKAVSEALPGVAIKDFAYTRRPRPQHKSLRKAFKSVRRAFIQDVAQNQGDVLRKAGLTDAEIASARDQGRLPDRFNVHHIKPLDDGGTNDFSNLVIMHKTGDHELVHRYLDPQIQNLPLGKTRTVRLPMPEGGTLYSSKVARQEMGGRSAGQRPAAPQRPVNRGDGR